jgi:hypothetical protein
MSIYVLTQLHHSVDPEHANTILGDFIRNSDDFISARFVTEQDNLSWLEDINSNPDSSVKHLKPADKDLSMDELKAMFPIWTDVGLSSLDIGFNRTSESVMQAFLEFINRNTGLIKESRGIKELINRCGDPEKFKSLSYLDSEPGEACYELPAHLQEDVDLSGIATVEGMNGTPYQVIFGHVDGAQFKKRRTHIHPSMDSIHRNLNGEPILLVQLMGIAEWSLDDISHAYAKACQLGMREDHRVFGAKVYGIELKIGSSGMPETMKESEALKLIEWAKTYCRQNIFFDHKAIKFSNLNKANEPENSVSVGGTPSQQWFANKVKNWVYYAASALINHHGWSGSRINLVLEQELPVA